MAKAARFEPAIHGGRRRFASRSPHPPSDPPKYTDVCAAPTPSVWLACLTPVRSQLPAQCSKIQTGKYVGTPEFMILRETVEFYEFSSRAALPSGWFPYRVGARAKRVCCIKWMNSGKSKPSRFIRANYTNDERTRSRCGDARSGGAKAGLVF